VAVSTDSTSLSGVRGRATRVWIAGAVVFAALVLGGVLVLNPGSPKAQAFGDFAILFAVVIASASCFRASRRYGPWPRRCGRFMGSL
jgi:hypothetical protein